MGKNRIRIPLGFQYLSFYIIILVIPVIFLGYIIHFYLLANLKGQTMASNEQKLIQMKDVVDSKLSEFYSISMQVSTQHELTPYYVDNFFDVFQAKKLLNYKVGNEFIYEIFYYIRGNDYLFSGKSSYNLPYFISNHFQFDNWTYDEFYRDMNESEHPFLRSQENVRVFKGDPTSVITYGVPIPFNSKNPYGTLFFLIKEQTIKDMFENVVNSLEGNAFIMDENNQIIATLHDRSVEMNEFAEQIKENENIKNLKIGKQTFYVTKVKSGFLDWSYYTFTPEAELMKDVNSVRDKVMFSYLGILIVGALLIYIGMRMNYNPLQKLIRKTEEKWSRSAVSNHHGIDKIWEAIDFSEKTNQLLSKRVEFNIPILRQHHFIRLLRGEIEDFKKFNSIGKDIDLQLNQSSYYIMLLEIHDEELIDSKKRTLIKEWLSNLPSPEKYQVDLFETDKTVFIVSGDVNPVLLQEWYHTSVRSESYSITIGVGSSYHEATQIGKSHLEASTALNYKLIKGTNQIIFFDETSAGNNNIQWYDKEIVGQLELYLRQRDKAQVMNFMEKIIAIIKSPNTNLFYAKCLIYDVSSTIMRVVHDVEPVRQELKDIMPDILQINDFHSIEEMEKPLTKVIQTLFQFYSQSESENQLLDDLLEYIKENYDDYQFSIQAIAEHLSLSEAYIMRYFKKQTGETILQYLNRLRMEQTKHLLKTTDVQIKEIALQVGYSDVSSFIRKFKQQEKLTPGEYRKKYQSKNLA